MNIQETTRLFLPKYLSPDTQQNQTILFSIVPRLDRFRVGVWNDGLGFGD